MKRKLITIIKKILLSVLIIISALVTIILFPQLLFANKMKYKNFRVCSNEKINYDIRIVLDNAIKLVQKSELYDPGYKYNIILCHNTFYNKIDDKLLGKGPAARATLNNLIIKVRIDPSSNLAFPTYRKKCEVDLTYLLAHEMIHCLQARKYGIWKFNPFRHPELWKLEGYPEYISRKTELSGKDYSLAKEIERYVALENKATDIWMLAKQGGCEFPNYYYKGRLMIEYLIDIRHQSYDQILKDSVSEETIFKEMVEWKESIDKGYPQQPEINLIHELFRLRNEHKADSAELLYADTVLAYMKYLRKIPRKKITETDRLFWKAHPKNKFEITKPVQVVSGKDISTATIFGKEYLDGTGYKKERIEIKFDRDRKIISFRGFSIK